MELTFLGAGAVKINGKQLTVVANPFTADSGLGKFGVKTDVVLLSEPDDAVPGRVLSEFGEAKVFDSPGEYEVKGAMINAVAAKLHIDEDGLRATMYSVVVDGVNVVVVGNIAPGLTDQQVEALGKVDVLVVPVGNSGLTLDATAAAEVVGRLEPAYVVPVHYDDEKTTYPMPQAKVDEFFKEMGKHPEPVTKLKINTKELPMETELVYLTRA